MVEVKKLPTVVNEQVDPNDPVEHNTWTGLGNVMTCNYDTYATSHYTRKKQGENYINVYPWEFTSHKFDLNLPVEASITSIQFHVGMRCSSGLNVQVPSARFCIYGYAYQENKFKNRLSFHETGIHDSVWVDGTPKPSNKISSQWQEYTYTLEGGNLYKLMIRSAHMNKSIMGVDLRFRDANLTGNKDYNGDVDVAFVYITVNYVMPCHEVSFSRNDIKVLTGEEFEVDVTHTQKCKAYGQTQVLDVDIPWGTEIVSYSTDKSTFDPVTRQWTVNGNTWITGTYEGSHTLHLKLKSFIHGDNQLSVSNSVVGKYNFNYIVDIGVEENYDSLAIGLDSIPRMNTKCCAIISIEGYDADGTVHYNIDDDLNWRVIGWSIVENTDGVSIYAQSTDKKRVRLTVPSGERFTAYLRCCFVPKETGTHTLSVYSSDTGHSDSLSFEVLDPYEFHISSDVNESTDSRINYHLVSEDIYLHRHRVITDVETENSILPFKSDDNDALMYQSKCGMSLYYNWGELDYIGCVPLEHLHFDPKSTYKDTLLNTTYKNKRYMGKKLASDEDISLNVRLHPKQVTTIQGLIDMDKPIPINANHLIWEGDALNHRGWAEIYSIKTEETNPHWYKCDIDVKYLTHNLNTRFNIIKGNKVNTYPISSLMMDAFESGESLSTDETNYFKVDTDGTYTYVSDTSIDPTLRNIFNIDNGQSLRVKTRNPLSVISNVSFEWNSTLLGELEENNISRIIRLVDSSNNPVFEYEYTDFEFVYDNSNSTVDSINCNVVYRVHTTRGWEDVNSKITLRTEISNNGIVDDDSTVVIDDDEGMDDVVETQSQLLYGSTLHFKIANNKLTLIDEGFSGKELFTENAIDLMGDEYSWETVWKNNNSDAETTDCTSYFDFKVQDTLLQSQFASKFNNYLVSPFPVAKKRILFSREAEEGSIYFYEDDGEEFSYMIEPFYQYYNGTDLVTDIGDGDMMSIFNLNYGYKIVYMQNGLVRLGFNRLDGRLYLAKYDPVSGKYINTHYFRLSKYDDINIKSISDDKIEVQASDTIFTIWRGHPYIMVNHPTEDLIIDSRFSRAWAEGVGSAPINDYPSYYDLLNSTNLLPSCIGGDKELKDDCIEVDTVSDANKTDTTLNWADGMTWDDIVINTDKTFSVSGTVTNPRAYFELDDVVCDFGDLEITIETDNTVPYSLTAYNHDSIIEPSDTTTVYAKLVDYGLNPMSGKTVYFYEVDYWFDGGVLLDYSDVKYTDTTYLTRGDDYTTITGDGSNITTVFASISDNIHIEFDAMVNVGDTAPFIGVARPNSTMGFTCSKTDLGIDNDVWVHYVMEIVGGGLTLKQDYNNTVLTGTLSSVGSLRFRKNTSETFKFKNLEIYSI